MPRSTSDPFHPDHDPDASGLPVSDYARSTDRRREFQELLDMLARGKFVILASFVLVTGIVAWYNFRLVPEYEASALLLVTPRSTSVGAALPAAEGGLFARSDRSLSNELVVIRNSLSVARSTAQRLVEIDSIGGTRLPILGTDVVDDAADVENIARRLQWGYVRILPEGRDVDVIRVTSASTLPAEAALIANLYSEEYVRLTRDASRARILASRQFLERQETMRADALRDVEGRLRDYMTREGAIALDEEGNLLITQLSQLEAARDNALIDLQMEEATLASLEAELDAISPQLAARLASGVEREIRLAQEKIAELELTRQQILLKNPELRDDPSGDSALEEIRQQISGLQSRIVGLSRQYVDEVLAVGGIDLTVEGGGLAQVADLKRQLVHSRIAISGSQAKIRVMDGQIQEYEAELRTLPTQTMEVAQLQRDRQSAERMYVNVVEKLQEIRIAEESEIGYAEIIREALVPSSPVRPNRRKNIALGALLSLALGVGLSALRRRVDTRIYAPDDVRELGFALLGVVPAMQRPLRKIYGRQRETAFQGRQVSTRLVTMVEPHLEIAEAYRHVRTNIQFSRPDAIVQTILVTSPNPGEGKSVTALNIAATMAQAGRQTVIVDADLRRPTVHEQLGLPRRPGFVELIKREKGPDLPISAVGIDDLYAITAGEPLESPSELLGSLAVREFIHKLRKTCDVIVFDSPPVFMATDAALLATQCDATIVVASAGSTKEDDLRHCYEVLENVGAHVIGTLLNRFEPSSAASYRYRYSYYGRYGAMYGYGYTAAKERIPSKRTSPTHA